MAFKRKRRGTLIGKIKGALIRRKNGICRKGAFLAPEKLALIKKGERGIYYRGKEALIKERCIYQSRIRVFIILMKGSHLLQMEKCTYQTGTGHLLEKRGTC